MLVVRERGQEIVAGCCAGASSAGVRAGMTLAHARSCLPTNDPIVQPFEPAADATALRRLARWALRFSPIVAADEPDGLLLDIAGCTHLWGGERRYVETLSRALEQLGLRARLAVASTHGCAWAVARFGREAVAIVPNDSVREVLAPLPVAALRLDARTHVGLAEVDIETVGDLLVIPRAELAARFGAALLRRLDEATGEHREPLARVADPQAALASWEFDGPIKRYAIIEQTVRELLSQLIDDLSARGDGATGLDVHFKRIDAAPTSITLSLAHPTVALKHLWALVRPKLERVNLGNGVEAICVRATRTARLKHAQRTLWAEPTTGDATALGELLDTLTARLGRSAVHRAEAIETHVPERAFAIAPADTEPPHQSSTPPVTTAQRPTRLFDRPESARVISLVPDGPPAWMQWRGEHIHVGASIGPERVALPWWSDGDHAERDYFAVQDAGGRWLWVFRDAEAGQWFVHGEWA